MKKVRFAPALVQSAGVAGDVHLHLVCPPKRCRGQQDPVSPLVSSAPLVSVPRQRVGVHDHGHVHHGGVSGFVRPDQDSRSPAWVRGLRSPPRPRSIPEHMHCMNHSFIDRVPRYSPILDKADGDGRSSPSDWMMTTWMDDESSPTSKP